MCMGGRSSSSEGVRDEKSSNEKNRSSGARGNGQRADSTDKKEAKSVVVLVSAYPSTYEHDAVTFDAAHRTDPGESGYFSLDRVDVGDGARR